MGFGMLFGYLVFLVVGNGGLIAVDGIGSQFENGARSAWTADIKAGRTNGYLPFGISGRYESSQVSAGLYAVYSEGIGAEYDFPIFMSNCEAGFALEYGNISFPRLNLSVNLKWFPFHPVTKGYFTGISLDAGLGFSAGQVLYATWNTGYRWDFHPVQVTVSWELPFDLLKFPDSGRVASSITGYRAIFQVGWVF